MKNTSPLYVWDFSLSCDATTHDYEEIKDELQKFCKAWIFQKEEGHEKTQNYDDEFSEDDDSDATEHDIDDEVFTDDEFHEDEFQDENDTNDIEEEEEDYETDDEHVIEDDEGFIEVDEQHRYQHFQGHVSTIHKKRKSELLKMLKSNDFWLAKAYWSPSSNTGKTKAAFYACKVDTRLEGPWTNQDPEPIKLPYSLQNIELHPFQKDILNYSRYNRSNRTINICYCPHGGTGKSTVAFYAKCKRFMNSLIIPPIMESFLDLNQAVLSQINKEHPPELLWLDIPRALRKDKMNQIMAFCEQAKHYVFDTRYAYKEHVFYRSPEIWLFCNTKVWEVHNNLLSSDRWNVFTIENKQLLKYPEGIPPVIKYPWKKKWLKQAFNFLRQDKDLVEDDGAFESETSHMTSDKSEND